MSSTSARLTRIRYYGSVRRNLPRRLHGSSSNIRSSQQQQWKSDAVFGCSLSTVGSLLTLRYQSNTQINPFQTNPLLMEASVVAMLVSFNASILLILLRQSKPFEGLRPLAAHVSVFSGALALILLGSMVLNGKVKLLAFLLCGFPWVLVFMQCFRSELQRIYRRTVKAFLAVLHMLGANEARNQKSLGHQLPTRGQT